MRQAEGVELGAQCSPRTTQPLDDCHISMQGTSRSEADSPGVCKPIREPSLEE